MRAPRRPGSSCEARGALRAPRGFTLVEMMTVLAVVGVTTALAVPQFTQRQDAAHRQDAAAALLAVQAAQENHRAQHGAYASSLEQLPAKLARSAGPYVLRMARTDAEHYTVQAVRPEQPGAAIGPVVDPAPSDSGCAVITLKAADGSFAQLPQGCWPG